MLIILLLLFALTSSSSTPVPNSTDGNISIPIVLLGRELPECMNIARFRTLQEIIWSCLVTIFACTWVAVHPNLPGPYDCEWTRLKRKVTITVYAIFAPELMMMWAMRQWFVARKIAKAFTLTEATPEANAGGDENVDTEANLTANTAPIAKSPSRWMAIKDGVHAWFHDGPRPSQSKKWTLTHGFFLQMGGFMLCDGETPLRVLAATELVELVNNGKVDLPRISEEEINDRSKGDFLTKLFVVLQTTWFIVQCLARWITHLPVTELEVVTLAFAALNIITYGLWWKKPQNVLVAVSIPMKSGAESEPQPNVEKKSSRITRKLKERRMFTCCAQVIMVPWRLLEGFLRPFGKMMGVTGYRLPYLSLNVPMFYVDGGGRQIGDIGGQFGHSDPNSDFPSLAIGCLFGALHLIPWSFNFHSNTERWLWRSSALMITTEPILFVLFSYMYNADWDAGKSHYFFTIICGLVEVTMLFGIPLYVLSRFILLVLAFATLRALPTEAYANIEWTTFVPHI